MIDRGHEDEESAGERDVRREACPLGAERLFGNLDDDLLTFLQEILDLWLRGPLTPASACVVDGGSCAAVRGARGPCPPVR